MCRSLVLGSARRDIYSTMLGPSSLVAWDHLHVFPREMMGFRRDGWRIWASRTDRGGRNGRRGGY